MMKMLKKWIAGLVLAISTLPALAAMTDAQQQTLAAAIRADANSAVVTALAQRNDMQLAALYNGASTFIVWRTNIPVSEYRDALVWTAVDGLTAGKARIWDWITAGNTLPIDASKPAVRQGIADAWGAGSATGLALTALAKRPASLAESLYTTGTGNNGNPGLLTWQGPLQVNDVSDALNKY
jgi:hypothetical protein